MLLIKCLQQEVISCKCCWHGSRIDRQLLASSVENLLDLVVNIVSRSFPSHVPLSASS